MTQETAVSKFFIFNFILVYFALSMALLTPPMMTIALRVAQVAPENKEYALGLLLGIGAVVSIFANPLAGYFSDRTTSKFGKRKVWMLGGTIVGSVGLWLIAIGDIKVMIMGWCLTQLGFNAVAAALTALLPDQVPGHLRGFVSGAMGMSIPAGMLAGIAVVNLTLNNTLMSFLVQPAILAVLLMILCVSYKDKTISIESIPAFSFKQLFKDFYFDPRELPDFSWAFVSRFMFFMALATFFGYQVYFLIDRLGFSGDAIPGIMLKVTLITSGVQIASSLLSGWLSDLVKRRKVFIWTSAVLYGVGLIMVALSTSFEQFLIGASVMSFSFGVYFSIDLALVTEVLPDATNNAAKDLGILNVAGTLPQTLAPAIAPFFLFLGNPKTANYDYLFFAAAVFAVLGAITIIPIKKVR
jgi:MFS family permease